jgi:hypothetical protein
MPGFLKLRLAAVVVVCLGFTLPAPAQDEQQPTRGYAAVFDHVDLLIDSYARFLVRKYDLTEEQAEYTKVLLTERSYEFLDLHEDNLRGLVDRLFDVRTGGDMTPEELIQWGQRVRPIYEEAKKVIIDGNDEWRETLTAEQRKIHDEDVRLMYQSFETTEDQLGRIVSGEMTVEEFRSPQRNLRRGSQPRAAREPSPEPPEEIQDSPHENRPPPSVASSSPDDDRAGPRASERHSDRPEVRGPRTTVRRPPGGRAAETPTEPLRREPITRESARERSRGAGTSSSAKVKKPESEWEKYVREFIEKYKLNDEQSQKATAVLEDCQAQADRYKLARKRQVEALDRQIEELRKSKDKNKTKSISALTEKRKKLLEPIDKIFEQQLKPRLERLPTRAQRRAADLAAQKKSAPRRARAETAGKKRARGEKD